MKSIYMMKAAFFTLTAKIAAIFMILLRTVHSDKTICSSTCYCDETGEYVSCVGDGVWKVLPDVPKTTVRLELKHFDIPNLSSENLHDLLELHELKLQQTKTKHVENGTFAHLRYLHRLEISQNRMTNLTSFTFDGLKRLRYLDMSSNFLMGIDESFLELPSVEQLNLRANNISQVTSRSFYGLQNVQYLNLDSNQIMYIEVGSFQYLTNLAHLILSNNPLTALYRLDFFGSRLQFIDISHMGLQRVPQSLTKFVRDLRLAKNNLSRISAGDFDSYPYLGLLVLDDNLIVEIESDALGRQEYLLRLWLNGNLLNHVPDNLPPSLQALYIEENNLVEIRNYNFKGLVNLEQLFLQRNKIHHLYECAFCDLLSLKSLDLQANQIEKLANGVFANLSHLELLDLSQNCIKVMEAHCFEGLINMKALQLSRIPTSVSFDDSLFDYLKNLQMLEIYNSPYFAFKIINSSRLFHGLRNLRDFNIMHNGLVNLSPDFPSFFPNLKTIKMSGNNWICDRQIMWLARWIQQSNLKFYRSYSIRCSSPPSLQFKPIMTLTEADVISQDLIEVTTQQTTSSQLIFTSSPVKNFEITFRNMTKHDQSAFSTTQIPGTKNGMHGLFNLTDSVFEAVEYMTTKTTVHPVETVPLLIQSSALQMDQQFKPGKQIISQLLADQVSSSSTRSVYNVTTVIVATSLASAIVILVTIAVSFAFCYYRYKYRKGGNHSQLRRNSSISYYPQQDEISIVTVSEGTIGLHTRTHCGLGNKLYYIMENGNVFQDPTKDAASDSQLQELLPKTAVSHHCCFFEETKQTDINSR